MPWLRSRSVLQALLGLCPIFALAAQQDSHAGMAMRPAAASDSAPRVGVVHFPNSGSASAQPAFIRGIALLHSFDYDRAAAAFRAAEKADPHFALPYWFEALTYSPVLWSIDDAAGARRALARLGPTQAARLAKAATPRERAWGAAVEAFYASAPLAARTGAFADSLTALAKRDTSDLEAAAFAALALDMHVEVASPPQAERTAELAQGIAFAQRVFAANPQHPGAAHYLIHLSDADPSFTQGALPAARAYAAIAPDVVHAQHMPSHVFLKLGMWDDLVRSNERAWHDGSAEVAAGHERTSELPYHILLWLNYGYLQQGRWAASRALIDSAKRFVVGAKPEDVDARYAVAMMQWSYAQETGDWNAGPAGALVAAPTGPEASKGRELQFIHRTNFGKLATGLMQHSTVVVGAVPDSGHRAPGLLTVELSAVAAQKSGDTAAAIALWRHAASLEKPIPPGAPLAEFQPHEALGALLLATGQPAEAAQEYEQALTRVPNRTQELVGLARSRMAAGDTAAAAAAYGRVLRNFYRADRDLPELAEARRGVAAASAPKWLGSADPLARRLVVFPSGSLLLEGFLFKPAGQGPFPTLLWNHGSEPFPGTSAQFDSIAAVFVPRGYAVFTPTRRGHDASEGTHIRQPVEAARAKGGDDAANNLMTHLLETEQLDDQRAALAYMKRLPWVDTTQMVVAGCSFGGIQTLLMAEGGAGFRAALPISPAAQNWDRNPPLRERLLRGIADIHMPVLLLQPPHDASLGPSRDLGAEFVRLHKDYRGIVYPDTLPAAVSTHCFGGAQGDRVWAKDALAFFDSVLRRP